MEKEGMGLSLAKLILIVSFIIGGGAWLGTIAYSLAHPEFAVNFGQIINPTPAGKAVNKIEISADAKSILNADTKAVIFSITDTQKYLKDSGYAYQPKADPPRADNPDTFQDINAKYAGECFLNAALSNKKDRIVFSSGCLSGDLPQPWIGIYMLPPDHETEFYEPLRLLIGGSGRNFVWSADDKTITYEADLGLSGMTETRTIDSATGEILERRSSIDTSNWKTYRNEEYGFEFKYPNKWYIDDVTDDMNYNFGEYKSSLMMAIASEPKSFEGTMWLEIKNVDNLDDAIKKFIDVNCAENAKIIKNEKIFIDNIEGRKIYLNGSCSVSDGNPWVFVVSNAKTYILGIPFESYSDNKYFNQILSTFKFTEPEE